MKISRKNFQKDGGGEKSGRGKGPLGRMIGTRSGQEAAVDRGDLAVFQGDGGALGIEAVDIVLGQELGQVAGGGGLTGMLKISVVGQDAGIGHGEGELALLIVGLAVIHAHDIVGVAGRIEREEHTAGLLTAVDGDVAVAGLHRGYGHLPAADDEYIARLQAADVRRIELLIVVDGKGQLQLAVHLLEGAGVERGGDGAAGQAVQIQRVGQGLDLAVGLAVDLAIVLAALLGVVLGVLLGVALGIVLGVLGGVGGSLAAVGGVGSVGGVALGGAAGGQREQAQQHQRHDEALFHGGIHLLFPGRLCEEAPLL